MKNLQNSHQWFSIVLAMWITIVISMIAILILEFIIPFTRNVKSVENWSAAYYFAYSWIEDSLWELSQNDIWHNSWSLFWATSTWSQFNLVSMTSIIPPTWDGNSEYDEDWNRFDPNTPIQLQLNSTSINFDQTEFRFRVPNISGTWAKTLSGSNDIIINWIFNWLNWSDPISLNASWTVNNIHYIRVSDIDGIGISIWWKEGLTLDWISCNVNEFYNNNGSCLWEWITSDPVLKLSIVNKIQDTDGWMIPYLEYQIHFKNWWWSDVPVPGRYSQIDTAGKSYGYKKSMDIKVPQLSTNQAFDFAVFQ